VSEEIRPKFERLTYGEHGVGLVCPGCGCSNLHHDQVDVYARDAEDSPTGYHATVTAGAGLRLLNNMTDNPSSRRDGLRVLFWCEQCPALSELTIVQHKGTTYLAMRVTGECTEEVET
jgi:hypothetical protein